MQQVKFIADIGSNHNQSMDRIYTLIQQAYEVGCWGVKFQLFNAETLYRNPSPEQLRDLKRSQLPLEFLPKIYDHCLGYSIQLGITPFSMEAVMEASPFVDFFKIGSYELLCHQMIEKIASYHIPTIISTGMASFLEVTDAVTILAKQVHDITILHCVSKYPALPKECHLERMWMIRQISFLIKKENYLEPQIFRYGWSDHTRNPGVVHRAVSLGMKTVEFHFDLEDLRGMESHHGHCWTPGEIAPVIHSVMEGEEAEGQETCFRENDNQRKQRMDPHDMSRPIL
jgi:N-acetylneuraminate synthase